MRSPKEKSMDARINSAIEALDISDKKLVLGAAKLITADDEVQVIQEYANNVSILRLGYNDHGPVHMRTVVLNVIIMMGLLRSAGIKTNLQTEGVGEFEDSLVAVIYGAMLHDLGMSIGRQDHEIHSAYISSPILNRLLAKVYSSNLQKKMMVSCVALECIAGHMGNRAIHSLEAGMVQIADGCDMTKGRARIPISLGQGPRVGDIHQYSANSIEEVRISKGQEKPIRIEIFMSSEVGLFQVEEVLMHKIGNSTAKSHIELYTQVQDGEQKRYL